MSGWPAIALGTVAKPIERPVTPEPGTRYRQIGVKLWGEGAYERESIDGSETRYSTLWLAREGDIVVNKIWARNGSVAVVQGKLDGCVGSNEFPTFAVDPSRLLPRWIHWLTKTKRFWEQCDEQSRGTSGKNRIRPEKFLQVTIPLPPLDEQLRLVERIDVLATKIEEAKDLQKQADQGFNELCRSVLRSESGGPSVPMAMCELVSLREPDVTVREDETYHFAGVYCFGEGVFVGQRKTGLEFKYPRLTRLRVNNFVYPKLMAWEGALAVVPPECDGLVVSTEYPVFEIHEEKVLPEVLDTYFRMPSVWPELSGASTGTNVRRRRLNPADFLSYEFPLPPRATQERLRHIKVKAEEAHKLRGFAQKEIDAMLPAILDRAFRGEM